MKYVIKMSKNAPNINNLCARIVDEDRNDIKNEWGSSQQLLIYFRFGKLIFLS